MAEQKPANIERDPEWKARELVSDTMIANGSASINLPYQFSEYPDREVHHTVSFSTTSNYVSLGSAWEDGPDARIGVLSKLTPEQARELAYDLQQAAFRAEDE